MRTGVNLVLNILQSSWKQGLWRTFTRLSKTAELKFGTLVGVDKFGNEYYEDKENEAFGRHRWVEYPGGLTFPWTKPKDPTTVPPEWHSWLHYMSDYTGNDQAFLGATPTVYKKEHLKNNTGTENAYVPTNYPLNSHYVPADPITRIGLPPPKNIQKNIEKDKDVKL
eukprot:TRINITY_DN8203_c0_g1_i1.p1 TRINITY_DN8203_c0_g1~~TRINITY_DN8203_c0_g1_i1.p1  ORF type:complete len:167 (-),score=27.82 TRINITY_DN8203_c0_g1_i1:65-565(-)